MKIFLASPGDVANYRQAAKRVADRLNEESGVKLGCKTFLEIVDWNTHIAPLMSLPEDAVLEQVEIAKHDVFVGVAWLGFDSLGADATAGDGGAEGADSGPSTERNFELAFRYWKERQAAQCLLYRCMRLPEKLTDVDGLAFDRVHRFFSRFTLGGNNSVRYSEFSSATDLEEQLASQLSAIRERIGGEAPAAAPATQRPRAEAAPEKRPAPEFEKRMQPGKAYEVSFLSIEIIESREIEAARKADPEGVTTLFRAFRELVAGTASSYGGEIFTWTENGGLLMFWASRSYDHAIMTGLKVLHSLPVFNLDSKQNPVAVSVRTRSAAHDAVIIFKLPSSDISSEDLDFVVELQRQNTEPAELSITRRLLELVDGRLKPHFKYKGRFKGEPVYACRLPSSKRGAEQASLGEFTRKLKQRAARVREILAIPPAELDISGLEALSTAIDETYSMLNKFCSSFSTIDREWPKETFADLAATALELMGEEADVWQTLRKCYVSGSFTAGKARKLEAIVQAASRRRSRPVVILDKLGQRCRALAASGVSEEPAAEPPSVDDELVKKIQGLVRADALDSETILTELLLNLKGGFLEYLRARGSEPEHRRLLDKLWQTADLVLLDDLYSIRGRQRANEEKVFDVLTDAAVEDGRFRLLRDLLARPELPAEGAIVSAFQGAGRELGQEDLQIIWRCLVLGHGEPKVRQGAALRMSRNSAWQAISLPNVPVASLYVIGERIKKEGSVDAEKIFFDCIRARLEHLVETFRTRGEAEVLTKLIMVLLDFPFLVETGYFERFDDILRKFLERSQDAGVKVEYFESLRRTLEEARHSADKSPSKPPAGIKKLPLTIQRRLAGESRYVYWFVSHPDPRIACETLRHVGLMNVERVLRLRELNQAVLAALLKKPELFTRSGALTAALHHPKCTHNFASRYLSTMARSRQGQQALAKIANDPSANPVVRSAAKRLAVGGARGARRGAASSPR